MKTRNRVLLVLVALAAAASAALIRAQHAAPSLASLAPIDAHAHAFNTTPEFYKLFERLNLRFVNICVVDKHEKGFADGEWQHKTALEVRRVSNGRAIFCSTFDPQDWDSPGFADRTIKLLNQTFDQGAVAVKIYKNIGMELKTKSGEYVMPDNPVFDPIMKDIEAHNRTVIAHIAEPTSAWQPLDPSSPDYSYYKTYPEWHMYLHPERPSKESILAARDRLVKRHPKLRFVGAHLGSMEVDVDEIAKHFDLYPNFAVDTAARIPYLMIQPRDKVRAFLIKYQDRVLYATDLVFMPWDDPAEAVKAWEAEYARDWKFFSTDETLTYNGRTVRGLALPEPVLKKLYHSNAVKWIPGIVAQ